MSTVTLKRPGWGGHGLSLHAVPFTLKFDEHGVCRVDDDSLFRERIEPYMEGYGVTVTRPPKAEPKSSKKSK